MWNITVIALALGAALIVIIVGCLIALQVAQERIRKLDNMLRGQREDYLNHLRIEIGKRLFFSQPEQLERIYTELYEWEQEYRKATPEVQRSQFTALIHSLFLHSVPSASPIFSRIVVAQSDSAENDITRYLDISKFLVVANDRVVIDRYVIESISKQISEYRDERTKMLVKEALSRWQDWPRRGELQSWKIDRDEAGKIREQGIVYEDDDYEVVNLIKLQNQQQSFEVEMGIRCKRSNEFAIEANFFELRDRYTTWYRSNADFTTRERVAGIEREKFSAS